MPSLRQLLAEHPTLLLIDTASTRVQVGLWTAGETEPPRWRVSDTEASTGLFECVDAVLREAGLRIADIGAFVFCEGPGSVLGIRTAAVALRSWRAVHSNATAYSYQSLDLVARAVNRPEVNIIADARRDTWHVMQPGRSLRRVPAAELTGELIMPEHFRHWTALPSAVTTTGYDVATLLAALSDADLFRPSEQPDAFMHEDPSYVTWTPQVHQAPRPAN
jgi:tRNA threonylcarbamoyladenosine biosynthesis protein TsaB